MSVGGRLAAQGGPEKVLDHELKFCSVLAGMPTAFLDRDTNGILLVIHVVARIPMKLHGYDIGSI